MNLQQLEYIIAVDKYRHFGKASESCYVTQPTLSSMIQKLEEELSIKIFDRNMHPVAPTKAGIRIIKQAHEIINASEKLKEIAGDEAQSVNGVLNIAVIPTIAPYLLPDFFASYIDSYPGVNIFISEITTTEAIVALKEYKIDAAIMATPLNDSDLLEIPLYYEKFKAYISSKDPLFGNETISASEFAPDKIWLLHEGHCFRNQIINLCSQLNKTSRRYEAGNIETLIRIVDLNGGYTIIPELHIKYLNDEQLKNIREINSPAPVREVSLVIRNNFPREGITNSIANTIKNIIPLNMLDNRLIKFRIKL